MNSTIAGFFDSSRDAMAAADALVDRGYTREQISVLASETTDRRAGSTDVVQVEETKTERAEKGAMLGGFAGLVVGLAAVLIPGVGPFLVLGPMATALVSAGVGATAGGLLGGLTKLGIPSDHAEFFVEGMRKGGTLLLVSAPASSEDDVLSVFRAHNAADVGERVKHAHTMPQATATATATARAPAGEFVVPVVEEKIVAGKQVVAKTEASREVTMADTVKKTEVSVQPLPARDSGRVAPVPPGRPSHP